MVEAPVMLTVGEVAQRLGVEQHQVAYVVKSRAIPPVARVGILRVFDESGVRKIAAALDRVRRKREGLPCT